MKKLIQLTKNKMNGLEQSKNENSTALPRYLINRTNTNYNPPPSPVT